MTTPLDKLKQAAEQPSEPLSISGKGDSQVLTLRSKTVRTLEGALTTGGVDQSIWEVERWLLNKWDMGAKLTYTDGQLEGQVFRERLAANELWQVKVWLRRKKPEQIASENFLKELKKNGPVVPRIKVLSRRSSKRRSLELCLFDPHLGLHCFAPAADHAWGLKDCEEIFMWALEGLLELAKPYGPVEEIVFPFGNDFLHHDNLAHTTTAGTPQPEAVAFQHVYQRGMMLSIAGVERMKQAAPVVKVKVICGNHARQSEYTLGQFLWGYYHRDCSVHVDASPSPYKFHRFGTNLIGYEHGHSVAQIRLAALMANEAPQDWAATTYREWHLGDQHRKGSSKPSAMEEQGVSVEFHPGLTPPNEWHRLKSYNWQKRGAVAYVWDYDTGPVARLQVNLNSYTGRPTGENRRAG